MFSLISAVFSQLTSPQTTCCAPALTPSDPALQMAAPVTRRVGGRTENSAALAGVPSSVLYPAI